MGVNIGTGNFSTINGSMNIFTGSNASETTLNIGTGNTNAATINVATGPSRPLTSITNIGGTVYLGSTTSTTTAAVFTFRVGNNNTTDGVIDSVTPAFYTITEGSIPVPANTLARGISERVAVTVTGGKLEFC